MKTYGSLSFTGETKVGPFWKQILNGHKRQTVRRPRKDGRAHVKVGYYVKLYWRVRKPQREKPGEPHLIGYARVAEYQELSLALMWYDESNALLDGFASLNEFRDWFDPLEWPGWRKKYRAIHKAIDEEIYRRIKWEYPLYPVTETTLEQF